MNSRNQKLKTIQEVKDWLFEALSDGNTERVSGPVIVQTLMRRWMLSPFSARIYLEYLREEPFLEVGGYFYLRSAYEENVKKKELEEELRIKDVLSARPSEVVE